MSRLRHVATILEHADRRRRERAAGQAVAELGRQQRTDPQPELTTSARLQRSGVLPASVVVEHGRVRPRTGRRGRHPDCTTNPAGMPPANGGARET